MTKQKNPAPLTFKTSHDDRRRIKADASASGLTVSSYIRLRLLNNPQTKAVYRRSQLRRLIMRFIGHIGRIGNNMNQIAHKYNTGQGLIELDRQQHQEGITALKEMRVLLIDFLLGDRC